MTDYVVFERSSAQGRPESDLFIRLTCSNPNEVSSYTPLYVEIIENIGSMTPIVVVSFVDAIGDLFNHMKLDTSAVFTLEFGRNETDLETIELKISKIEQINGEIGRPAKIETKITFVLKNWYDTIGLKRNRGWTDKTISEIVAEISSECDFDDTFITDTEVKYQSIIQPYSDNGSMISYLKNKAYIDGNDSHFEYGVNCSNQFFFKNMNKHFEDHETDIKSGNISVLKMQAVLDSYIESEQEKSNNLEVPAYFYGIKNTEHYLAPIVNGASGMRSVYYDFFTDELKTEDVKFSDSNSIQWSDYSSVREENEGNLVLSYGGREEDTIFETKTKVSELNLSMNQFEILTNGSPLISIFDFVELIIPNTVVNSNVLINQIHSGIYLVGGVKQSFSLQSLPRMTTTMTLYRHGCDDYDYEGLMDNFVVSSTGKGV